MTAPPLDRIDVEGLKTAAEKATRGEWKVGRHFLAGNISIESVADRGWIAQPLGGRGDKQQALDFAFIALANPATILELIAQRAALVEGHSSLYRAYVRLLEVARDRIIDLGGACDPVDVMEEGDPALIRARALLSTIQATGGGE